MLPIRASHKSFVKIADVNHLKEDFQNPMENNGDVKKKRETMTPVYVAACRDYKHRRLSFFLSLSLKYRIFLSEKVWSQVNTFSRRRTGREATIKLIGYQEHGIS